MGCWTPWGRQHTPPVGVRRYHHPSASWHVKGPLQDRMYAIPTRPPKLHCQSIKPIRSLSQCNLLSRAALPAPHSLLDEEPNRKPCVARPHLHHSRTKIPIRRFPHPDKFHKENIPHMSLTGVRAQQSRCPKEGLDRVAGHFPVPLMQCNANEPRLQVIC